MHTHKNPFEKQRQMYYKFMPFKFSDTAVLLTLVTVRISSGHILVAFIDLKGQIIIPIEMTYHSHTTVL